MMKKVSFLMFLSLLFGCCGSVYATNVTMSGSIAYEIKGNDLTVWVERITNNSLFTTSGTLRLKLWATEDPYIGGTIEGYILGTYTIGTLQPFHYITSLKVTTFYDSPPLGHILLH